MLGGVTSGFTTLAGAITAAIMSGIVTVLVAIYLNADSSKFISGIRNWVPPDYEDDAQRMALVRNRSVRLRPVAGDERTPEREVARVEAATTLLAFSPDGSRLAVGDPVAGRLALWPGDPPSWPSPDTARQYLLCPCGTKQGPLSLITPPSAASAGQSGVGARGPVGVEAGSSRTLIFLQSLHPAPLRPKSALPTSGEASIT